MKERKRNSIQINDGNVSEIIWQLLDRVARLEKDVQELKCRAKRKHAANRPLLTSRQREIFKSAINAGLMEETANNYYHWNGSIVLLSYFIGRLFCEDKSTLGVDGRYYWDSGVLRFPTTLVEKLFGIKRVDAYRRQRKVGNLPKGYKLVDDLW